jgi:lysophospholipase L1-like esterase
LWLKLAAALAGVLLSLGLAELALRVLETRSETVKVEPVAADSITNPLGLRDRWDCLPPNPEVLRIAFLGDSFTYGLGVEADQAFVRRVGVLLRDRWSGACLTVNLGRPGVDLISAWAILNRVRDELLPDVVVHVLTQDDLDVDLYRDGQAIERYVAERTWPARHSRLFNLAETAIRWSRASPRIINNLRGGATPELRERAWRIASFQIRATQRLVEEAGGRYVLIRFPCLRWMSRVRDYPLEGVHHRSAELAAQLSLPYLDLWETFRGRNAEEMCLSSVDDHPTPAAHQIAAQAICDYLVREVLGKVKLRAGSTSGRMTPRGPQDLLAAEIRQYQQILQVDPTCGSARFWLSRVGTSRGGS